LKSWKELAIKHTPLHLRRVRGSSRRPDVVRLRRAHNTDFNDVNHGNNATSGGMNPGMNDGSVKSTHPAWPTASTFSGSPDPEAPNGPARWRQT